MSEKYPISSRKINNRDSKELEQLTEFSPIEIYNHFCESIKSVKEMSKDIDKVNKAVIDNILRSQIVFSEAAMDFYIHEISKYQLYNMYSGKIARSKKYFNQKVEMKMSELERYIELSDKSWFFEYLNNSMSRKVFLDANKIAEQLNLIGAEFNKVMEKAFPMPNADNPQEASRKYGEKQISKLFKRRNQIAHQNDRSHYNAKLTTISVDEAIECIDIIERIIYAIHKTIIK